MTASDFAAWLLGQLLAFCLVMAVFQPKGAKAIASAARGCMYGGLFSLLVLMIILPGCAQRQPWNEKNLYNALEKEGVFKQ